MKELATNELTAVAGGYIATGINLHNGFNLLPPTYVPIIAYGCIGGTAGYLSGNVFNLFIENEILNQTSYAFIGCAVGMVIAGIETGIGYATGRTLNYFFVD